MRFCSSCGSSAITFLIPQGDNRARHVCGNCNEIHYQNPRIICGTLPVWEGKVLLCKRAIEPRYGYWTLPAGFMENGESVEAGALRETQEEACATILSPQLLTVLSVPAINQVHMMFWGVMPGPEFSSTPESLEVALFTAQEIPWGAIAFRTVKTTLEHYFECQKTSSYSVLVDQISR